MCPVIYIRGLEATVVCALTVCAAFHAVRVNVCAVYSVCANSVCGISRSKSTDLCCVNCDVIS